MSIDTDTDTDTDTDDFPVMSPMLGIGELPVLDTNNEMVNSVNVDGVPIEDEVFSSGQSLPKGLNLSDNGDPLRMHLGDVIPPQKASKSTILDVKLPLSVSIGVTFLTLTRLINLKDGDVVKLDCSLNDDVHVYLQNKAIATAKLSPSTSEPNHICVKLSKMLE